MANEPTYYTPKTEELIGHIVKLADEYPNREAFCKRVGITIHDWGQIIGDKRKTISDVLLDRILSGADSPLTIRDYSWYKMLGNFKQPDGSFKTRWQQVDIFDQIEHIIYEYTPRILGEPVTFD